MFRKKKDLPSERAAPSASAVEPRVVDILQRLERAGVQLLMKPVESEAYTSEVVGLGRDAFFVDTLSPPDGDRRMRAGSSVQVETLFEGITYTFTVSVLGKVQFVDELPAFKLSYPSEIQAERRRKSPRVETRGDASLSFLQPFQCDAPVVNLSEGGLAFEYPAEVGRLRKGTVIRDVLLELGSQPVITVQGRLVGNVVAGLGGISLPERYRASLAFQGLSARERKVIQSYLAELKGVDVTA